MCEHHGYVAALIPDTPTSPAALHPITDQLLAIPKGDSQAMQYIACQSYPKKTWDKSSSSKADQDLYH